MYAELKRICTQCLQEKPLTEFYKFRNNNEKRRSQCKPCSNKMSQEYRNKNKESCNRNQRSYYSNNKHVSVAQNLKRYYGMTVEQYEQLLAEQDGKCAICNSKEESSKKRRLSVDHDHKTGEIRGLLCDRHNRALGLLNDSVDTLQNAINYLNKFKN